MSNKVNPIIILRATPTPSDNIRFVRTLNKSVVKKIDDNGIIENSRLTNSVNAYYKKYTQNMKPPIEDSNMKISDVPVDRSISLGTDRDVPMDTIDEDVSSDEDTHSNISHNITNTMNKFYKKTTKHMAIMNDRHLYYNPIKPTQDNQLLSRSMDNSITQRSAGSVDNSIAQRSVGEQLLSRSSEPVDGVSIIPKAITADDTNKSVKLHSLLFNNPDSLNVNNIMTKYIDPTSSGIININNVVFRNNEISAQTITTSALVASSGGTIHIEGGIEVTDFTTDLITEKTSGLGVSIDSESKPAVTFNSGKTTIYGGDGTSVTKLHTNAGSIPAGIVPVNVCSISLGTNSSIFIDFQVNAVTDIGNIEMYKSVKVLKRTTGLTQVQNGIDLQRHDNWSYNVSSNTFNILSQEISGVTKKYNALITAQPLTNTSTYTITFL